MPYPFPMVDQGSRIRPSGLMKKGMTTAYIFNVSDREVQNASVKLSYTLKHCGNKSDDEH